jgi:Ca-activated chloride channel family protein
MKTNKFMKKLINLTLLCLNIFLLTVACHNVQKAEKTNEYQSLKESITPNANQISPPSLVIEEVPEEEIEEDEPQFVDQTIEENTEVELHAPPPPPPPPPAPKVEEIFKFVPPQKTPDVPSNGDKSQPHYSGESYASIIENDFLSADQTPLSTFSIDVDNASYSNSRRFLNNGQLPPPNAVRIEEFINYFSYDYPQPEGEAPFSVTTEMSTCPWNSQHQLMHIGLQGRIIPKEHIPPSNLVFLLDVSGSMNAQNKLPLLKNAFKMLTNQLRQRDRVAIVVYAGASGLVLPSTSGANAQAILEALQRLEAGGGTAGAAGIELAYQVAQQNFINDGNNRVILATDGDFNIGMSSNEAMVQLIENKRKNGIFLSVLGFGTGNYQDDKMEQLADNGNGNYAYIDNLKEAKKVLVNEMSGTLFTIAKDVKLQLEFNPAHVAAYRLIGYENRKLKDEDFNDDTKDAGELGAGHTVTALYEIIPTTVAHSTILKVDPLKYQSSKLSENAKNDPDWLTLKLRYKHPKSNTSKLLTFTAKDEGLIFEKTSSNFRFSAAVAGFGMLLRDSRYKGSATYDDMAKMARNSRGEDPFGYRIELIDLIEMAAVLDNRLLTKK